MEIRRVTAAVACAAAGFVLAQCGEPARTPTTASGPVISLPLPRPSATPTPAPTPGPTPSPGGGTPGLPAGMVCDPTPPPLHRFHAKVHSRDNAGRLVLDSKPIVVNVDGYCDRVGFGDWKYCDTRPEGHPQRAACDYLVAGRAPETGRWGPSWTFGGQPCSSATGSCANHSTNQFMTIAKANGTYVACASDDWPVAASGTRCGEIEVKDIK